MYRAAVSGGSGIRGHTRHHTPHTIHPTPYTLHPTPYTPHVCVCVRERVSLCTPYTHPTHTVCGGYGEASRFFWSLSLPASVPVSVSMKPGGASRKRVYEAVGVSRKQESVSRKQTGVFRKLVGVGRTGRRRASSGRSRCPPPGLSRCAATPPLRVGVRR